MERSYWHKQAKDKPLFPDLLWSRPENRLHAGKLMIAGGNLHGFMGPAEGFTTSSKAGIGVAKVVLPDALRQLVGTSLEECEFGPSTPSGSFSQRSLETFLRVGNWADGVLVAGDLGRNSETAILLEKFIEKYDKQLTITKDAIDYFTKSPLKLLEHSNIAIVVSFAQLQKIGVYAKFPEAFTFEIDILRLVDMLHSFTTAYPIRLIVRHLSHVFVAIDGKVSSTKMHKEVAIWRLNSSAYVAVWWLQNPSRPFESITTAMYEVNQVRA